MNNDKSLADRLVDSLLMRILLVVLMCGAIMGANAIATEADTEIIDTDTEIEVTETTVEIATEITDIEKSDTVVTNDSVRKSIEQSMSIVQYISVCAYDTIETYAESQEIVANKETENSANSITDSTTDETVDENINESIDENTIKSITKSETNDLTESEVKENDSIEGSENNSENADSLTYYSVPSGDTNFYAYMDYRTITNTSSEQYKLQQQAWTDSDGLRRVGDSICVAMGSYYSTNIGDEFLITLESGNSYTVILADCKADVHTDANNQYRLSGNGSKNVIEFIVDSSCLSSVVKSMGSVGALDFYSGNIVSIQKIN